MDNKATGLLSSVPLWYASKQKGKDMAADALGRLIRVGDVCGFANRRGSNTYLDIVVIKKILPDGLQGVKLVNEAGVVRLIPTKRLRVTKNLIITDLQEKEAIELVRLRKV